MKKKEAHQPVCQYYFVTSQKVTFQNNFFLQNGLWDFYNKYVSFVCTTQRPYWKNILHGTQIPPVLSEEVDDVKRRPVHQSDRQVKRRLPLFLKHMRPTRECKSFH